MSCPQCWGIEEMFNREAVAKDIASYAKQGATGTTRVLIDALKAAGVEGLTLLDIGGGVGAIQHELLRAGAAAATGMVRRASRLPWW